MTDLVSIIIPCYKQAHLLPEAVASVLAQTHSNWELIIVNDGSPDDTSHVAQRLIAGAPPAKIRLLEKTNGGLADARNVGIGVSSGSWIVCLDSDDKLHRDYLSKTLSVVRRDPSIDMVYCDIQCFGTCTDVWPCPDLDPIKESLENELHYSALYARRLWENLGGYQPIPLGCEDYDFWLRCMSRGFRTFHINEPLFLYRRHQESSMVDRMSLYKQEVYACVRTCNPELYSVDTLLEAHSVLAAMRPAVREEIEKVSARFEDFMPTHFWLGVHFQATGDYGRALKSLEQAKGLASEGNWQVALRLGFLYRELGRVDECIRCLAEVNNSMPPHPLRALCLQIEGQLRSTSLFPFQRNNRR